MVAAESDATIDSSGTVPASPEPATPAVPRSTPPLVTTATTAATADGPAPTSDGTLEDVVSRAIGGVVLVEATGSRGTGFFVAPDLIITNEHVAGSDSAVTVRLHDGTTRAARVERTRIDLDLALLRTAALPAATVLPLGRADAARVGQEVIAIGSALGLQSTVTRGILSAKRQSGAVLMLQTDAAINPGNSGGPLLDRTGAVLGVTTLKVGGTAEGLGFAVAADYIHQILEPRAAVPVAASAVPSPSADASLLPIAREPGATADGQRAAGTDAFERALRQLAQHAAQIDAQWARFASTCQPAVSGDADRQWLALTTQATRFAARDRNCPYWLADLEAASRTFGEAMRAAGDQARRAGVYPGDQRTLRRRYRLDWSGFER